MKRFVPGSSERGVSALAVILVLGLAVGGMAATVLTLSMNAQRVVTGYGRAVGEMAGASGDIMMGAVLLAERLQQPEPVTARQLSEVFPGVEIEDEGGKVSVPLSAYCLPEVMRQFSVSDVAVRLEKLLDALQAGGEESGIGYPIIHPVRPTSQFWVESPEALGDFWELPVSQLTSMRRWFTICPVSGINVNTADERCVAGVLAWHRKSASGWTDRAAKGHVSPHHLSPHYAPGVSVTFKTFVLPMPSHEPLVFYDVDEDPMAPYPDRPDHILEARPPASLFPLAPGTSYDTRWQLVQVARKTPSGVEMNWVDRSARRFRYRTGSSPYSVNQEKPYAPSPNAWMRGNPVEDAEDIVDGRESQAYRVGDLTQSLGLFWYTPEAYFLPLTPSAIGEFTRLNMNDEYPPPPDLNVGLSAAAFSGWVSLQGPGPYRAASEWFTFISRKSSLWTYSNIRWTMRVFPEETPRLVASQVEVE